VIFVGQCIPWISIQLPSRRAKAGRFTSTFNILTLTPCPSIQDTDSEIDWWCYQTDKPLLDVTTMSPKTTVRLSPATGSAFMTPLLGMDATRALHISEPRTTTPTLGGPPPSNYRPTPRGQMVLADPDPDDSFIKGILGGEVRVPGPGVIAPTGCFLGGFGLCPVRRTLSDVDSFGSPGPIPITLTGQYVPQTPPTPRKRTYSETTTSGMTPSGSFPNRPDFRTTTPAHDPLPADSGEQIVVLPGRVGSTNPSDRLPPTHLLPATTSLFCRHDHWGNKTLNWSLSPTRPVLIVGASNMSRLPLVLDPAVQVDCFPGAKVFHALHLLRNRTPVSPRVRLVVLHFGLNDRTTRDFTRLAGEIRELYNAALATFPQAVIRMAMLNVSSDLAPGEWHYATRINEVIEAFPHRIPPLRNADRLRTTDGIHWTPDTAVNILALWRRYAAF